jgi:hypothetical protein
LEKAFLMVTKKPIERLFIQLCYHHTLFAPIVYELKYLC